MLKANGFDNCVIGCAERHAGSEGIVMSLVYDREKMVKSLSEKDGLSEEEAQEYLDFNTLGAYVGPEGPLYMYSTKPDDEDLDTWVDELYFEEGLKPLPTVVNFVTTEDDVGLVTKLVEHLGVADDVPNVAKEFVEQTLGGRYTFTALAGSLLIVNRDAAQSPTYRGAVEKLFTQDSAALVRYYY